MAKITPRLNTDYAAKNTDTYPIIIVVRDGKKEREFPTGERVTEKQWKDGQVIKHPDKDIINSRIADKVSLIHTELREGVLLSEIGKGKLSATFIDYLRSRKKSYEAQNKTTSAIRIGCIINELMTLFGAVPFQMTIDQVRAYEAYLIGRVQPNTMHKRFALCRQMFAAAIREGVYRGQNPFELVRVRQVPVKKDRLTEKEIQTLSKVKLTGPPALARDIFLFSYYAKGIRFENCVFLHWKSITDGRIYVRTNKGQEHISIQIHPKLQAILDRYPGNGFVFHLVKSIPPPEEKRKIVDPLNTVINRGLKLAAAAAGITKLVTFHLARHSISFHLKQKGVPISSIKDVLGHSSVAITEKYLQALDDEILDKDMRKVYGG